MNATTTNLSLDDVYFLIPARAGSKGILKKNLQKINDKTLVEISINQAKSVGVKKNIFVTSDSLEILKIAGDLGISQVLRTKKESSDSSDANAVVEHFITFNHFENLKKHVIVYLQPTSPFRDSNLIKLCINEYKENLKPVVTVRKVNDHPKKMITIEGGEIQNYLHDFNPTGNRQEFFELYIPSGSVYVFSIENFIENGFKIPIKGAIPIEVQNEKLIDINTEYDLLVAQRIGENFEFSN